MIIRPAEIPDYESIAAIRDTLALDVSRLDDLNYAAAVEEDGFLAPVQISKAEFTEQISNYVVGEVGGAVAGFLRLDDEQEMDADEVPIWIDPAMEEVYWQRPHANIGKVAVLPEMGRKGIASAMLAEAERRASQKGAEFIFSFIVTCQPPTNLASIRFHAKNGFQMMAPLETQTAYGIDNYVATLYGRKLSA